MSASYDVIVVGAGPAGSSCARRAAELGMSVVVVERSTFPRSKPCAAGLTYKALDLLGGDEAPVAHRRFDTSEIAFGRHLSLIVSGEDTLVATTTRRELDERLAGLARAAGAVIDFGRTVKSIEEDRRGVRVRVDGDTIEAGYAVVADGARGAGRAMMGLAPLTMGGSIYVRLRPTSGGLPDELTSRFLLDPTATRRGYGWIFPKRDHLNVGVFSQRPLGPGLKRDLSRFLVLRGLEDWASEGPFAFPTPVERPADALGTERVLFAGDAAGLISPVTGEGIPTAIASGRIAAAVIASGGRPDSDGADAGGVARAYSRRIRDEVLPMSDGSKRNGELAYGLGPGFFRLVARTPLLRAAIGPAWRAATRNMESLSYSLVVPERDGSSRRDAEGEDRCAG